MNAEELTAALRDHKLTGGKETDELRMSVAALRRHWNRALCVEGMYCSTCDSGEARVWAALAAAREPEWHAVEFVLNRHDMAAAKDPVDLMYRMLMAAVRELFKMVGLEFQTKLVDSAFGPVVGMRARKVVSK